MVCNHCHFLDSIEYDQLEIRYFCNLYILATGLSSLLILLIFLVMGPDSLETERFKEHRMNDFRPVS